MKDLTLSQLRLFATVARLGSFSRAGHELGRAQPGISREMIDFEREVGGKLFHRTGRGVVLSPLGEQLLPRVQLLLKEAENLRADIDRAAGATAERVAVGLVPTMAAGLGAALAEAVRSTLPDVQLHLLDAPTRRLSELMQHDELDLAMMFKHSRTLLRTEDALLTLPIILVGKPGDALLAEATTPVASLEGRRLICPPAPNQLRLLINEAAERAGIAPSISLETDSPALQKELAARGHGYAVMTMSACWREVAREELAASRLSHPDLDLVLTMAHAPARAASKGVKAVGRILRRLVKDHAAQWAQPASAE